MGIQATLDSVRQTLGTKDHADLAKTVRPQTVRKDLKGKYDTTKVVFSSRDYGSDIGNIEEKGYRRMSDPDLREISQVDPYISAIIANRCAQGATIGYETDSKFDKGTRMLDLDAPKKDDYEDENEYQRDCKIHEAHQKAILKWVLTCGTNDQDVVNVAFAGGDLTFKHCTLREFLEAQIRNLLTFGRCATQVFRNEDGLPVMFRPVAVETIRNVSHGKPVWMSHGEETADQSLEDAEAYNEIDPDERPYAYAQVIDGKIVNFFTEDDLHVWHWQKQALFDLNGYPLSPIEQAMYMVFVHQQTLSYLRNQFVKGMGNKGMITMEATQAGVEISDADMENFRQQFHNFVTRNDNSAAVPVIGGPIKVNYIPLSSTPRDMEFLQVEEHVIRALCSAFQISPMEMGYGHLGLPSGQIGTSSNRQDDVIKGEERGLRMLLDIVYDGLNTIVYANFPDARDKYRATYTGVGEDTRDAVVNRQQMELNTTATINSLLSDSEKSDMITFGGDVPLNPSWHANVVRFFTFGEVREYLFKQKGDAKRPEYDFIVDPTLNEAYQALKVQPLSMQQAGASIGLEQQKMELQGTEAQMQAMAAGGGQPQEGGGEGEEQPQEQDQAPEPTQKSEVSLRDKWLESQKLRKSMRDYFGAFQDIH